MASERIVGYRMLDHMCQKPGCTKRADVEVKFVPLPSHTDQPNVTLATALFGSMPIYRSYCKEHSPINIDKERVLWKLEAMRPPGS